MKHTLICGVDDENIVQSDTWLKKLLSKEHNRFNLEFCFAAHEMVINSVEAMREKVKTGNLVIELEQYEDRCVFSIIDHGEGLSAEQVDKYVHAKVVEAPEDNNQENGRGFYLIRKFTDRFIYEPLQEGNYKYTIIKYY